MTNEVYNRLKFLKDEIIRHDELYHGRDNPIISDIEYDNLCIEYDKLLKKNPNLGFFERSNIGFKPLEQFIKVKHKKSMLSLNNGFTFEDVNEFINRIKKFLGNNIDDLNFFCEPKIDGLSISLVYKNGNLFQAITRGDGTEGELVTENICTISNIPKKIINCPKFIEIRGEVFISKKDFVSLNKKQKLTNKKQFSNPRNAAAGSIRQKNVKEILNRKLQFNAYTIGEVSDKNLFSSQDDLLKKLKIWGFDVPEDVKLANNISEIKKFYESMSNKRNLIEYEIDGLVYKVNSFNLQKRLGELSRAPRWAIAHKMPSTLKQTIIEKIDIQIGRTGLITPVARVKKVNIGGVNVSNVTLHNEDEIKRKDIRVGDTVTIERAGDVIPHIVGVVKNRRSLQSKKFSIPNHCPSCGFPTLKRINEAARKCLNTYNCDAQIIERIIHFCSKSALNIEGLAEKQIKLFYKKKLISDFSSIFNLHLKKNLILDLDGFGELSVTKLLDNIENSKNLTFDRFLISLGINQVGENTAKILAENYKSIQNLIFNMDKAKDENSEQYENLINIDQIGISVSKDLIKFFNDVNNRVEVGKLLNILNVKSFETFNVNSVFSDKRILITGTLKNYTRDEIKTKLQTLGARIVNQMSKNVDILICGDRPGSKLEKAKKADLVIIYETQLHETIKNLQFRGF